jgi:hypothetical protein
MIYSSVPELVELHHFAGARPKNFGSGAGYVNSSKMLKPLIFQT